jgi:hypothetical protein
MGELRDELRAAPANASGPSASKPTMKPAHDVDAPRA